MIGSVEVRCCAAQPQKPLAPVFSFKDSPQSFRILDVPKSIGTWELTRVYVGLNYPDNTNVVKDATRQGNVWVATVEGCPVAGKTMGGFTIYADGTDENGNAVEGYVLGNGDVYVMEKSEKISALVGKTTMRILDDIPSAPAKGDVLVVGEELKIYNGEEWVTISGGSSEDTYTKAEIDEMVDEIDSSISALADEIPTKTSDLENDSGYITSADIPPIPTKTSDLVNDSGFLTSTSSTITELESSVSQLENSLAGVESSMSELESSMTSLESSMTELDGLAVKYDDAQKTGVHLGVAGRAFTLSIPDNGAGNGKIQFRGVNHISRNTMTLGVADTGETVGNTHVQLGDSHAPQAQLDIGANVNILSFNEEGKSQILIDGERLVVVTPEDVAEGKTLVATYVQDTPVNSLSTTRGGETMAKRDNPEGHWEYVSANLPSKTSELTNDSGYITQQDTATWRTWEYKPIGLRFKANQSNSTISMNAIGNAPSVSLEYSQDDGATWSDFIVSSTGVEGTTVTLANVGDEMLLRAKTTNGAFASDWNVRNTFAMTGDISISGNFYYLLDKEPATSATLPQYAFLRLFYESSGRFNIEGVQPLNWGLERACYAQMFNNSGLYGKVPENLLPATSLQPLCYSGMFIMTNISSAPELPATTLAESCYWMLFDRCPSLNSIKIAYTGNFSGDDVPTDAFLIWVNGLTEGGTLYYNGSDATTGASAIPTGWSVQTF